MTLRSLASEGLIVTAIATAFLILLAVHSAWSRDRILTSMATVGAIVNLACCVVLARRAIWPWRSPDDPTD